MDATVFFDLTKRQKWSELEETWLKFVETPSDDPKFYQRFIAGMKKRDAGERCDQLLALLVQNMAEEGRNAEALKIARLCLKLLAPAPALREAIIAALAKRYGQRPNFTQFFEVSGLKTDPDGDKAFTRFLTMANLDVGEAYIHKSWGVGTVSAIDPAGRKVTLRFPGRAGAEFTFAGAQEFLKRLPRAYFLARLSREPDAMRQLANADPCAFVKIALETLERRLRVATLKLEMTTYMMSDGEWRNWWSRSREQIRVDPWIDFKGSGLNVVISLRDKPLSIYEQSFEMLKVAATPRKRMEAARSIVRANHKSPIPQEELAGIERWVISQFAPSSDDASRIETLFILDQLRKIENAAHVPLPFATMADIVRRSADPLRMVLGLEVFEYQAPVLDAIREARADWLDVFETALPRLPVRIVVRGVQALMEGRHLESLRHVAEELLTNPARNVDAYLWAVSQYIHGRWAEFAPALTVDLMMEQLLERLAELFNIYNPRDESAPDLRAQINSIRQFFEENQHANSRKAVSLMSAEASRRFYDRLQTHPGLDSTERAHIAAALRAERPELEVKVEENLLTSIYHYVTKESYEGRMTELQRIRSVDLPANSARIGYAADHGDLSENAEYDAAKEEQARLMQRMNELEHLIRYARLLDPRHVKTDHVGPGTRVRVQYGDGTEQSYVLLGVWDADPEKHILSYRSPLGSQFLKRRVGDALDLNLPTGETRHCRIKAVENGMIANSE